MNLDIRAGVIAATILTLIFFLISTVTGVQTILASRGIKFFNLSQDQKKRGWRRAKSIASVPASHISCGDLDSDGLDDLVLTYFAIGRAGGGEATGAVEEMPDSIRVLWGDKKGFLLNNSLAMEMSLLLVNKRCCSLVIFSVCPILPLEFPLKSYLAKCR